MAFIDIRSPLGMREVSCLLLQVAQEPLKFEQSVESRLRQPPGIPDDGVAVAAVLARQACASVVSNCVTELWSSIVGHLHALEPDFPLYPSSVIKFVDETRLPFLSYMRLYYNICKKPFDGTATQQKTQLIVDMRHAIEHDKPETFDYYADKRIEDMEKWKKRLLPMLGSDALGWLPRVRHRDEKLGFQLMSEPIIFKFMKYPVAKWVYDTTGAILEEMSEMLFGHAGKKKLAGEQDEHKRMKDLQGSEFSRLWNSGE